MIISSKMKIYSLSLLILLFTYNITPIHTLRCAHNCAIDPTPFGSPHPIKTPCDTVEVNATTTVCAVFLFVNFETGYIDGALNEKARSNDQSIVLHLSSQIESDETRTFISYQCSTKDRCDEEFVRETIRSSNWSTLNETQVRADLSALLFEFDYITDDLICDNGLVCLWFEQCIAELHRNGSVSTDHRIHFDNNFTCGGVLESYVKFDQYFHAPAATEDMVMITYCDKNNCNQRDTIELVHEILRKDFVLPLNYSAFTPKSDGLDRRMNSTFIFAFLFFFHWIFLLET